MRLGVPQFLVVGAILTGLTGPVAAQTGGTVSGKVTDATTQAPLSGARVSIPGTTLSALTSMEGRYRLINVPAGTQSVRFSQIGYAAQTLTATVTAGQTTSLDAGLSPTPYRLDEIVTTATGEESRRSIGNAVSTVEVANLVATTPIANMNDLLVAKAPGVVVLPGALTGGGARVRIRGNSSLSLSNNPIYIVDGIRVAGDVNSTSNGIGGSGPSRINDLNPEDIESIDVVRGPSASTLYGTDAANGVIVIKTKQGRAGATVWNAYAEQGYIKDYNKYPIAYRGWRTGTTATTNSTAANTVQCLLSQVLTNSCVQDSVTSYNLWEDPESSVLGTGSRNQFGLQASGGGETVRYYVAGEWEKETGLMQLPETFQARVRELRSISEVPDEQVHPNRLRRVSVRGNINANLNDKMDVTLSSGFITSALRLPQTDNNANGIGSNGFGGPGFKNYLVTLGGAERNNLGWRQSTPDESFAMTNTQNINRSITSVTFNYRPTTWLSGRVVGGVDFISREDLELCIRDQCPFVGTNRLGFKVNNRTTFFNYTGDASLTANYNFMGIGSRSTAGVQYAKENNTRNLASASELAPGASTIDAGALLSAGEATYSSVTLGYFAEQQFSFNDRLYLTGAIRSDRNSAFGNQFKRVYYPKVAVSYVISDEDFFPKGSFLNSLRLRSALGAAGRQPGGNDAIAYFTPTTVSADNADTPGIIFSALGNPNLKPERSQELELGFDANLLNVVNLEFTYYNKNSRDALISRVVAPSVGAAATRFENIGQVRNRGVEVALNVNPVNGRSFGWDFTLSGSYNKNKIVDLGGTPPNLGTTNSDIEGYPIQGWWMRTFTYEDRNGDGLIALDELTVTPENEYIGPSMPVGEFTFFNAFELFGRKLRIQTLFDAKTGGYQLNGTERIRCDNRLNCDGVVNPNSPLEEQARAMAVRVHAARTQAGYVEKSDIIRFRELSATFTFPDRLARTFGASRMSLTAAGRNLAKITGYSGIDPDGGYFGDNIGVLSDFQTTPPPTYFTFRLNMTF